MTNASRYFGQALLYALFFVPLTFITQQPTHRHLGEDMAVLKVAVRHAGKIIGACTPINAKDQNNRPANMQLAEICPRERSPLQLELVLDGNTLYRASVAASGLHRDGVASMYRRFNVPAGSHHVQLQMNDDVEADGYTWHFEQNIQLQPAQVMVASFKDGFRLQ